MEEPRASSSLEFLGCRITQRLEDLAFEVVRGLVVGEALHGQTVDEQELREEGKRGRWYRIRIK